MDGSWKKGWKEMRVRRKEVPNLTGTMNNSLNCIKGWRDIKDFRIALALLYLPYV